LDASERTYLFLFFAPMLMVMFLLLKKPRRWFTNKDLARWDREYEDRSNHWR
jgi:hypothetical protein